MRLFFAIDLPERLHDPVAALQNDLREAAGLSFTDPEQAHVTMKFLGETPSEDDADAGKVGEPSVADAKAAGAAAVDAAGLSPFEVTIGGLGAFPSAEYISVLWAGVREGADDVEALASALETETTDRGFDATGTRSVPAGRRESSTLVDAADHAFTPHVTLARMNDARGKGLVQDRLDTDPTVGRFTAEELRLTRSTLGGDGADHETIARFPL